MRVLFSSTSGYGHVIPMLPLARAFRDGRARRPLGHRGAGDAAGDRGRHRGCRLGSAAAPRRLRSGERCGPQAEQLPGAERAAFVFPRMFGEALTPPMAADLLGIARDWGPDLLVHEHAELAAPLVGALLGVPSVTHSFGTAVPVAILDETGRAARRAVARARPRGAAVRRLLPGRLPRHLPALGADHAGRPHPEVQPLRPVRERARRAACDRGAARLRHHGHGPEPSRAAAGRRGGGGGLPVRVLVALGPQTDPASLGEQPEHVQVEAWVDQAEVLAAARRSSRTAGPAPSWVRWRTGCPSSACRRRPTSSATPRAGSARAPPGPRPARDHRRPPRAARSSGCWPIPTSRGCRAWRPRSRRCRVRTRWSAARVESPTSTTTRGGESHFRCQQRRRAARRKARRPAEVLGRSTAVVSHGGSGTFLGALARGVPQLCLPQARRPVPQRRGRRARPAPR